MADPRRATFSARLAMTLAAVAATLGGWLALASRDAPPAVEADVGGQVPSLPPLPTLEPMLPDSTGPASRRPKPIATTRSSR